MADTYFSFACTILDAVRPGINPSLRYFDEAESPQLRTTRRLFEQYPFCTVFGTMQALLGSTTGVAAGPLVISGLFRTDAPARMNRTAAWFVEMITQGHNGREVSRVRGVHANRDIFADSDPEFRREYVLVMLDVQVCILNAYRDYAGAELTAEEESAVIANGLHNLIGFMPTSGESTFEKREAMILETIEEVTHFRPSSLDEVPGGIARTYVWRQTQATRLEYTEQNRRSMEAIILLFEHLIRELKAEGIFGFAHRLVCWSPSMVRKLAVALCCALRPEIRQSCGLRTDGTTRFFERQFKRFVLSPEAFQYQNDSRRQLAFRIILRLIYGKDDAKKWLADHDRS